MPSVRTTRTARAPWRLLHAALACALLLLAPAVAGAYARGIDTDTCAGCHSGARVPAVNLEVMPPSPMPGSIATLRVVIQAINGPSGGFALRSNGPGAFQVISGQPTRLVNEDLVVHSAPGTASGGQVTFDVRWQVPTTPGGVDFDLAAVSANRDGSRGGDGGGNARVSVTFGCTGTTYYRDLDLDGFGGMGSGTTRACTLPMGYATRTDDCNDSDERVNPGAAERCNMLDDNCNGMADEGLASMMFFPDMDGDGFGGRGGTGVLGCGMAGYGVGSNDCNDRDRAINPGATEVCDGRDNNCNGQTDERVRPVCGVGWCARASLTCELRDCTPGPPMQEVCNLFDDDCDGAIDNGASLCTGGRVCHMGECVPAGSVPPPDAGTEGDGGTTPAPDGGAVPPRDGGPGTMAGGCAAAPRRNTAPGAGAAWGALVAVALACARRRRGRHRG